MKQVGWTSAITGAKPRKWREVIGKGAGKKALLVVTGSIPYRLKESMRQKIINMPVVSFFRAKMILETGFESTLRRSSIHKVACRKMNGAKGADR